MSRSKNAFLESNLSIGLLAEDTVFYGIVAAMSRLSTFILIPILARSLSIEEFGILDTLLLFTNVALLMGNAGIDAALMYFYHGASDVEQDHYVAAGLWLRVGFGVIVTIAGVLSSTMLTQFVFGPQVDSTWTLFSFLVVPFTLAVTYSLDVLRVQHERRWFLTLSLCRLVFLLAGTGWIFSRGSGHAVEGFLLFRVVPDLLAGIILVILVGQRHNLLNVSRTAMKDLLRYGAPFLPASLAYWGLSFVDRWFLYHLGFLPEVGIYALASKIGLIVMLLATAIQMAFGPFSMAVKEHEGASRFYSRSFGLTMYSATVLVLILSANVHWLVVLIGGVDYDAATLPAGILLIGNLFYVAFVFFSTGANIQNKTIYNLYSFGAALITAVGACVLFVPLLGATGAAIGIALANLVLAGVAYVLSQSVRHIPYSLSKVSLGVVVSIVAILGFILWGRGAGVSVTVTMNAIAAVVSVLIFRFIVDKSDARKLIQSIMSIQKSIVQ